MIVNAGLRRSVGSIFTRGRKFYADFTSGILDPRINFSRTSNATVTNSLGTIAYAPHNLLTYSEQFDNAAWTKTTTTITANSLISPDGNTTADTLTAGGANSTVLHSYTAIAQSYVFSVWLRRKTGTGNIDITADGTTYVTKAITTSWVRYETAIVPTAGTRTPGIRIATNGDEVYAFGAQLEIGTTATTYNSTTVKNLLGYSELFDNAAWTKSNSFVQTNLLTYSEQFDNAAWATLAATKSANTVIAPNGYQTADTLIDTAATSRHSIFEAYTTSALTYTFSIYAKAGTLNYVKVGIAATGTNGVYFNLATGAKGTEDAGFTGVIENVGNGWYRCSVTTLLTAAANYAQVMLSANGSDAASYTGLGTGTVYIWGAQLVQGSTAGDYRRTDAAALPIYYANHNGVVCAEKLVEDTVNGFHSILIANLTAIGGSRYISFYVKAGERNIFRISDGVTHTVTFNLTAVTATAVAGTPTNLSIASVGNGYYRCGFKFTSASASSGVYLYLMPDAATLSYTGDGISGIYIFGAQLSDSASLDPYVLNAAVSPTAAAYYGARFDYDPVTLQPKGLLIEEQRSNLLVQSENFATTWTLSGCKAFGSGSTINATTSPDGTVSADLITPTAGSAHYAIQTATVASGASYTTTIYAKPAGYTWILLWSNTASLGAYFDVANGVIGTVSSGVTATITKVANGFYRCSITRTTASTSEAVACFVAQSNGVFSYTSDETSGMYLWGAQLEAGSFATSYIPTGASQVTRTADVATIQGSNFYSWYNQNEGSIFANASSGTTTASTFPACVNFRITNLSNNQMSLIYLNSNTNLSWDILANTVSQASITIAGTAKPALNKMVGTYKVNDFQFAVNNTLGTADTSGITPIIDEVTLGRLYNNTNYWNGHIKQISYYNTRLADATLKGLTA